MNGTATWKCDRLRFRLSKLSDVIFLQKIRSNLPKVSSEPKCYERTNERTTNPLACKVRLTYWFEMDFFKNVMQYSQKYIQI